jgi:hypothetical protein
MRASNELASVLRMAEALAAGEPSRQVTLAHLAEALLRSAQSTLPEPGVGPPPRRSPAAAKTIDRTMQLAAGEGGQVAERRHLAAALAEIVRFRAMVNGDGPFTDRLPEKTPEGGTIYHLESTTSHTLSVRRRRKD